MKQIGCIIFIFLSFFSCSGQKGLEIEWIDNLQSDFSFAEKWSYQEGIFRNEWGQLACDGLCDPGLDEMRDENGRIIEDFIIAYYQLLDTTHYFHSHTGEAKCYEWVGTDFAQAYKGNDTVVCHTMCNAGTHSSLQLKIIDGRCFARIELNSIANTKKEYFDCEAGYIKIDKSLWDKGILKTEFELSFTDPRNTESPLWWNGKIYTGISVWPPLRA